MFVEWVTAGVGFGISAFFAVFAFAVCAGIAVGMVALIASVLQGGDK